MQKVAISLGDINGVGIEIALKAHSEVVKICRPIYCINEKMLAQAAELLGVEIPDGFELDEVIRDFQITPGIVSAQSGQYSYDMFIHAIELAKCGKVDAICTMPINKESWDRAGIKYHGHTEVLRDVFEQHAIMMLGCEKLFVALYTEHVPLRDVFEQIKREKILSFLLDFQKCVGVENIGVLALNPHAGDGGVLGSEEVEIVAAIIEANRILQKEIFHGPLVPDTTFTKKSLESTQYFVAMYHDQGLAPLKSLFFEESINVSLNLPIIRTSVDHGTAFDIAYKNRNPSLKSYLNAIKYSLYLSKEKKI